jgi:hypothetical protein
MKKLRILSLGAGVQSTTIALMAHRGELPPIDRAIFADTQDEPSAVYMHLEWLMRETASSFKTDIVTIGRLGDHLVNGVNSTGGRFASVPFFTLMPDGSKQKIRRQCTKEYKTGPIERHIRRGVVGLQPGQRIPKDVHVQQLIGLSFDEPRRVVRVRARFAESVPWGSPEFPLFDREMTRGDCVAWLRSYGIPHEVPRSACVFCPYTNNARWQAMKENAPEDFARAVEIDRAIRVPGAVVNRNLDAQLFVHPRCQPLDEVDFTISNQEHRKREAGEMAFDFADECEGMCGL